MENQNPKNDFLRTLASSFSKENNFESLIEDYPEVSTDLIFAHNICCHYTNMNELDERHQAAIQRLWFVIEAIINEGIKADSEKKKSDGTE